jgi:hypothetical protein
MSDWVTAIASVAAVLVSFLTWLWDRQRRAKTQIAIKPESASFSAALDGLSPVELRILHRVDSLSERLQVLEGLYPTNSPMNTAEGTAMKAKLLQQLGERELMKAVGVSSLSSFRAMGQNLQRLRLVDYGPLGGWIYAEPTLSITELGTASLREESAA